MDNLGLAIAIFGASFAVLICCIGSGRGVGMVGEASAGVLTEDPSKFTSCLILQILPGTQGLYGLVIWFWAMLQLNVMAGDPLTLTVPQGIGYLLACMPMAFGGYFSAIAQARCAASGVALVAKRPEEMSKGIILTVMVEFYAILCLLASFLTIMFLTSSITG
ncbi:MAG: V-type ATP synthase subunit K [Clostridiales bacterium]|nr:V-type ATP synthase subunit K [Clostridiales bacterium]MCC8100331.1 V-type ATP synthase subunit K [Clostridiales bacterium]MCD7757274.1 V-type ATP synthase subunit K [Clostridiales bacterium]MCD8342327.1 V-type ATP synthase subunit K [Clostridiales bacterium]MCD8368709.1 V-type ATP synthase subunit K [Clostridiales bacterium]